MSSAVPEIPERANGPQPPGVARGAIFNTGAWGFTILITLLATPLFVAKFGIEGYGVYALLSGFFGYSGLLDFGIGPGIVKHVSEYRAEGDIDGIRRSANIAFWIAGTVGLLFAGVLLVGAGPLVDILRIPASARVEAVVGARIVALGLVLTMLIGALRSVLQGYERYDLTGAVTALGSTGVTIGVAITLILGHGLIGALAVHAAVSVVTLFVYFAQVRRHLPSWRPDIRLQLSASRGLLAFSANMFAARLATAFNQYVIRYVVAVIAGPAAVTLYVVPARVVNAIGGVLGAATTVVLPYASRTRAVGATSRFRPAFAQAARLMMAAAIPAFMIIILLATEILEVWVGAEFRQESVIVLRVLAISHFLAVLTMVPFNFAVGFGRSRLIAGFSLLAFGVTAVGVFALTPNLGIVGAAGGRLIGVLPWLALVVYFTRSVLGLSLTDVYRDLWRFHIWGVGLAIVANVQVRRIVDLTELPWLVAWAGTLGFAYCVAYLVVHSDMRAKLTSALGSRGTNA